MKPSILQKESDHDIKVVTAITLKKGEMVVQDWSKQRNLFPEIPDKQDFVIHINREYFMNIMTYTVIHTASPLVVHSWSYHMFPVKLSVPRVGNNYIYWKSRI